MARIEHWPESGMLKIVLREDLLAGSGREVAPGVVFHYSGRPSDPERELVFVEIESWAGRDLEKLAFERFNDAGELVAGVPLPTAR